MYEEGTTWYAMPNEGQGYKWAKTYGTEMALNVKTQRSWAREILYASMVLLAGDVTLSESLAESPERKCLKQTKAEVVWQFAPPMRAGLTPNGAPPLTITLSINRQSLVPTNLEMRRGTSFGVRYQLVPSGKRDMAGTKVTRADLGEKGFKQVALVHLVSIKPLVTPPQLLALGRKEVIDDRALGIDYAPNQPTEPLSEQTVKAVIADAKLGKKRAGSLTNRKLMCGPDALIYLLTLTNSPTKPDQVLRQFPDVVSGTNLGSIIDAGKSLRVSLQAFHDPSNNIEKLPIPSIVSIRPAHFSVVVEVRKDDVVLISPPDRVQMFPKQFFRDSWTGYFVAPTRGGGQK